jgi:hypothetical protein
MNLRRQVTTRPHRSAIAGDAVAQGRDVSSIDRPEGRTVTAQTSPLGRPVAVSDQRSGGSWPDRRDEPLRWQRTAETVIGRSTGKPAASSDPSPLSRRWEPGSRV